MPKSVLPPRNASGLAEYLAKASAGFMESDQYRELLDGDYRTSLDSPTYVCFVFVGYLEYLVGQFIGMEGNIFDLKSKIASALDVIEILSGSGDTEITNYVVTGILESFDSIENDLVFNTIVNNLGPRSRALWDKWIPLNSTRRPKRGIGLRIANWNSES